MALSRKELRDSILNTTRQDNAQIGTLVNDFINFTLAEINNPGWSMPNKNYHHLWSFLRQKTSFATVASTSDYVLGREVDKLGIVRQTTSPVKLLQIPDELFLQAVPDPTETGNPKFYRLWETEGVATRLSSASALNVVSDSASDAGSAELAVSIWGYVGGIFQHETYQLNGATLVSGSKTFQAREILVSKQKDTTGTISIKNSAGTTILTLGPKERMARFKIITLYPIPSSAITIYVEFYTRIHSLFSDSDVPQFDETWHPVVRLGALAKVYQYLNKTEDFLNTQAIYSSMVRSMVAADKTNPDLIEHLEPISRVSLFDPRVHGDTDLS